MLVALDPTRRWRADDAALLASLGRHGGMAVRAVGLAESLRASRQRLVETREEERRRVGRDLHDDLGPTLASIAMQLGSLRGRAAVRLGGGGPARAGSRRRPATRSPTSGGWPASCAHRPRPARPRPGAGAARRATRGRARGLLRDGPGGRARRGRGGGVPDRAAGPRQRRRPRRRAPGEPAGDRRPGRDQAGGRRPWHGLRGSRRGRRTVLDARAGRGARRDVRGVLRPRRHGGHRRDAAAHDRFDPAGIEGTT